MEREYEMLEVLKDISESLKKIAENTDYNAKFTNEIGKKLEDIKFAIDISK